MTDEHMNTQTRANDYLYISPKNGTSYLYRPKQQATPIRYYSPNRILRIYKQKCPLFTHNLLQENDKTTQHLIHILENKTQLTCRNTFKHITKNKIKGLTWHNSCHDCPKFYEGLIPQWEKHVHPQLKLKTRYNQEHSSQPKKHSNPKCPHSNH